MTNYSVRVELRNADEDEYANLQAEMEDRGFVRLRRNPNCRAFVLSRAVRPRGEKRLNYRPGGMGSTKPQINRRCIPLGAECRRHTLREEPKALHRFLAPVVGRIVQQQRRHAGAGLQLAQADYYS